MSVGRYIVQDSLGRDVFITPEVDQTLHDRYANESYLRGLVRRERYEQDRKFVSSRHYGISTEGFKISGVGFKPQIQVPEVRSIDDMKVRQEQIERIVADIVPFPNLDDPKAVRAFMDQVVQGKDKKEKDIERKKYDEEKRKDDLRYVEMEDLADKISQADLKDDLTDEDEISTDAETMYDSTITEEKDITVGLNRYGEYDAQIEQKDRDILRAMKQNGAPLTAFYEYQVAFDKWSEGHWPIPYWLRNASDIRERGLWRKDVDTIVVYREADYYVDFMSNEYFIDISKYIHLVLLQDKKRFIYVASNDYALVIGRRHVDVMPHRVKDPITAVIVSKGTKGWVREEEGKMFKFCVRCKGTKMTKGCEIQRYTDVSLGTTNFTYFCDGKNHPGFIIAKMVDGSVTNYEFNGTGQRVPFFKRNTHIVSLCGYHNLIKGLMLEGCTVMGTRHLDMCCGRGGDFHRILARRFSVNVFVDRDFYRIEEFYTRYHDSSIDASLVITNDFSECVYEGLEGLFESISCFFLDYSICLNLIQCLLLLCVICIVCW